MCVYISLYIEQISKNVGFNNNMVDSAGINLNNQRFSVGVLTPPDKVNHFVLYSDREASQNIKKAQYDVYVNTKRPSFEDRYSTPKSVFYAIGASALALGALVVRGLIKK